MFTVLMMVFMPTISSYVISDVLSEGKITLLKDTMRDVHNNTAMRKQNANPFANRTNPFVRRR